MHEIDSLVSLHRRWQSRRLVRTLSHGGAGEDSRLMSQWQQIRALHATRRQENVVVGGLVVAGGALALQYGLRVRVIVMRGVHASCPHAPLLARLTGPAFHTLTRPTSSGKPRRRQRERKTRQTAGRAEGAGASQGA